MNGTSPWLHDRASTAEFYRETLLQDIVPFWFPRCLDPEHGGFFSALDRDGSLLDTDKFVWAQGRMSWMLLTLYNTVEPREEWLTWAESGLKFLSEHCFDVEGEGRMFFHVSREGQPIRQRRYAFSEAFAAQAWAAHARATSNADSARRAWELFKRFNKWNFTPGLMPPKFTDTRPLVGLGPYMIALGTAQELRDNVGESADFTDRINWCLKEIRRLFVKPELAVVMETVGREGDVSDHFDGRTLNPGHALECAWFILREAQHRGDESLVELGCDMVDWMWERGWDIKHGGLYYFRDLLGKPVQEYWHDMKFWWPHNEAILATLLAWKLTGQAKYAEWHRLAHEWSFRHFADAEHGEWFGYLHRDGTPSVLLKGNMWKSFYHLPRMLWYGGRLLDKGH